MTVEFEAPDVLESVVIDLGREFRIDPNEEVMNRVRSLPLVKSVELG